MHSRVREVVTKRSEVRLVMELFCEDVWHIEFYRNLEYLYLLEAGAFHDVFFMEAEVIYSSCSELFWPIHTGMVVVVSFDWKRYVYLLWLL